MTEHFSKVSCTIVLTTSVSSSTVISEIFVSLSCANNPKEKKKKINEQVNKEIALVRKEKKKNKIDKPKKSNIKLKVGDSVRMFDGRSVGSIDLIEKNKAIVNYGVFKTQVSLDLLELVEDKQNKK